MVYLRFIRRGGLPTTRRGFGSKEAAVFWYQNQTEWDPDIIEVKFLEGEASTRRPWREAYKEPEKPKSNKLTYSLIIGVGLLFALWAASQASPPLNFNTTVSLPKEPAPTIETSQDYTLQVPEVDPNKVVLAQYVKSRGDPITLINNPQAKDPTWEALKAFILQDPVDDRGNYSWDSYLCSDACEEVHNSAEAKGIKAGVEFIFFTDSPIGHAINIFNTTDRGQVFIDCTPNDSNWKPRTITLPSGKTITTVKPAEPVKSEGQRLLELKYPLEQDQIGYIELGKLYGTIDITRAKAFNYSYYTTWSIKWDKVEVTYDQEGNLSGDDPEMGSVRMQPMGIVSNVEGFW